MNDEKNVINRLSEALASNENDFGKILFGEQEITNKSDFNNKFENVFIEHFVYAEDKDNLRAIALIATLYLSVIHCNFPRHLFRTSINYIRNNIPLKTFNCNHYESIYKKLSNNDNIEITLFKNINKFTKINLTKNQIFDAFDFLSNGL